MHIQEKLDKALKTLHFLRYVIISDFYQRKQCQSNPPGQSEQARLHPAVRSATGKSPKFQNPSTSQPLPTPSTLLKAPEELLNPRVSQPPQTSLDPKNPQTNPLSLSLISTQIPNQPLRPSKRSPANIDPSSEPPRKIPRYVPPKQSEPDPKLPSRGVRHKIRKRVIVGNISKWIPPDWREDAASHKWTMYVRASKEESDISEVVAKVRFFLHPSYRPNDVVDVTTPPFHLCRRGWGEFPLRVQLHFKNQNNKPMDIIHHLKLDRTYTGLQTLGSETVVDIWINTLTSDISENKMADAQRSLIDVKQENHGGEALAVEGVTIKEEVIEEIMTLSHVHFDHDYASLARPDEGNVTIAHSPTLSMISDKSNRNCHVNGNSSDSGTLDDNIPRIIQNGGSVVKPRPKILENGSSILRPLQITIPSPFDSLNVKRNPENPPTKQILVLKNNNDKIIKLDMIASQKIVSLLKKPNNLLNLKLDPSKSIILNSTSNIPVLKIADAQQHPRPANPSEKLNGKYLKTKVVVGKDKTNLGGRREFYDKILRTLEEVRIPGNVQAVMRYIIKRIPIVSPHSVHPEYRRIHPYSCGSNQEFLGFNPGKQRALEWYRAKAVRGLLRRRGILEDEVWTIKEIMLWCRLHGFTPVGNLGGDDSVKSEKLIEVMDGGDEQVNSCTEPGEFVEWLQECKEGTCEDVLEDEEEVDVVGVEDGRVGENSEAEGADGGRMMRMEVPKSAEPIYSYVCHTARQIGMKLEDEEVVEGVMHGAAGRVLVKVRISMNSKGRIYMMKLIFKDIQVR